MSVARIYSVGTPYNGVELADIDFEQTADVMYLAHIDHAPTKLLRYGHDHWEFATVTFGPAIDAPSGVSATASTPNTDADNGGDAYFPQPATYGVTAINAETGQESRLSATSTATNDLTLKRNSNTITWAAVTGADRYYVYKSDNTQDFGYIGSTDQLSFVDDNIGPELSNGPPGGQNPFSVAGDYPSTVTFFEQRLMFARTNNRPNGIWGSKSSDYENFDTSRPLKDSDALALGVVAGRVNAVNQLASVSNLLALTSDSIFKIDGANDDGYLSPQQVRARRQIGRGSSRLGPLVVDNVVFYRPSVGESVRTIGYTFELDGYQSSDVSIFSPHLMRGFSIVSWAYCQEPDSIIWAARSDGKLLCFTWEQEQQVWGWTLCETDGKVESVCAISEAGEDRLYLTVRRVVGGVERVFIERMAAARWNDRELTCFLDCSVSFFLEEPQTVFSGLWHLEGRTVWALADGAVVRDLTVTNGTVTLPSTTGPSRNVTIGLPYSTLIETLPLILPGGANVGRKQQLGEAVVRLINSGPPLVGPSENKLYQLKARGSEAYGEPDDLLNGPYSFSNESHVSESTSLVIKQDEPLPLHLTAAFLEPNVSNPG
ncbi:hypothetical protein [Sphingomonas turrisvirgatae]|uniref:Ubiquitin-activating enzyme E1 FCCH domain-containing protein n=1 Tax=Sphingomonas turrisvirgatae TaxID=1888892 RepID=A0A1E3M1M4_9SPHN|nr:hypothetical protein [Sphingomonas turrisvirgatae]ODP39255.1 hypothetical protein BFL28_10605 [Sphingomonas turrisvirgatae]